ncbi:MAG: carboxylating nicotinate-nucleotide diphosphorylase [Solirubrobacterales bacterium]|nr:carboxylating nicotinate-nucleotide diphosphorylase [Solirubrobacterales bacterium]
MSAGDQPERELSELVARTLAEDLGEGDVTSGSVVSAETRARARLIQKAPGVISGLGVAGEVFAQVGARDFEAHVIEGQWREQVPAVLGSVSGPARALLAGERTALNLLCHLSGVATLTAHYVEAVAGTAARILDTRKTMPGLRALEKRAVRDGGGLNHRSGLYDAILIKENHAALGGGTAKAVRSARMARPELLVEVECRDLDEVRAALGEGAGRLLLDNMSPELMREAVSIRDAEAGTREILLEASGGISLDNVRAVAESGVELISVGALTHSAPSLDISLLLERLDD